MEPAATRSLTRSPRISSWHTASYTDESRTFEREVEKFVFLDDIQKALDLCRSRTDKVRYRKMLKKANARKDFLVALAGRILRMVSPTPKTF